MQWANLWAQLRVEQRDSLAQTNASSMCVRVWGKNQQNLPKQQWVMLQE